MEAAVALAKDLGTPVAVIVLSVAIVVTLGTLWLKARGSLDEARNQFTANVSDEVKALRGLVYDLRKEQTEDRAKLHQALDELSEERAARREIEASNRILTSRVEHLERVNNEVADENETLKSENADLRKEVATLRGEVVGLREDQGGDQ